LLLEGNRFLRCCHFSHSRFRDTEATSLFVYGDKKMFDRFIGEEFDEPRSSADRHLLQLAQCKGRLGAELGVREQYQPKNVFFLGIRPDCDVVVQLNPATRFFTRQAKVNIQNISFGIIH
jgi:hypothetical protein